MTKTIENIIKNTKSEIILKEIERDILAVIDQLNEKDD